MSLRFCPRCRSLLMPSPDKKYLVCINCGYKEEMKENPFVRRSKVEHSSKDKLVVVTVGATGGSTLKGVVRCPKCGHDEVYAWMMQTRAADEPPTRFYKCAKCGHTWREYA